MGVITESLGMRPAGSGVEQPDIGDRSCPEDPHEDEKVLRIEVLDLGHTGPRRWRTSLHRRASCSALSVTRGLRPLRA